MVLLFGGYSTVISGAQAAGTHIVRVSYFSSPILALLPKITQNFARLKLLAIDKVASLVPTCRFNRSSINKGNGAELFNIENKAIKKTQNLLLNAHLYTKATFRVVKTPARSFHK